MLKLQLTNIYGNRYYLIFVEYFQIFLFSLSSESEASAIEDDQVEENENSTHTDEESEGEEEGSNVNEEEEQEESEEMEDDGQDCDLERKDNCPTDQNGMADSTVRCVLCLLDSFNNYLYFI